MILNECIIMAGVLVLLLFSQWKRWIFSVFKKKGTMHLAYLIKYSIIFFWRLSAFFWLDLLYWCTRPGKFPGDRNTSVLLASHGFSKTNSFLLTIKSLASMLTEASAFHYFLFTESGSKLHHFFGGENNSNVYRW